MVLGKEKKKKKKKEKGGEKREMAVGSIHAESGMASPIAGTHPEKGREEKKRRRKREAWELTHFWPFHASR